MFKVESSMEVGVDLRLPRDAEIYSRLKVVDHIVQPVLHFTHITTS